MIWDPAPILPVADVEAPGTLCADDEGLAAYVGRGRNAAGERNGWRPRLGTTEDRFHIDGARGELWLARAYGVPWNGPNTIGQNLYVPDVANVDVRTTRGSRLFIHDRDPDPRPHVLVIAARAVLRIAGWLYNREAKAWPFWDATLRWPCYAVDQAALRPPGTLPIFGEAV